MACRSPAARCAHHRCPLILCILPQVSFHPEQASQAGGFRIEARLTSERCWDASWLVLCLAHPSGWIQRLGIMPTKGLVSRWG